MSIGANAWIPLRAFADGSAAVSNGSSDAGIRIMPKIALGGLSHHVMWSFGAGFMYRTPAKIGNATVSDVDAARSGPNFKSGPRLRMPIPSAGLRLVRKRFFDGSARHGSVKPFGSDFTSLEVLLGFHYNIAKILQLGVGGGLGLCVNRERRTVACCCAWRMHRGKTATTIRGQGRHFRQGRRLPGQRWHSHR